MKKKYIAPEIEIQQFEVEDIIALSDGLGDFDETGDFD
jgi:hypothetical protein